MRQFILYICCFSLLLSCQKEDILSGDILQDEQITGVDHIFNGSSANYTNNEIQLDIAEIVSIKGDFFKLTHSDNWSLEIEQNDDDMPRKGIIRYKNRIGELVDFSFAQLTKATSSQDEIKNGFIRNYGLGFSYDAVAGQYCDYKSVKCQVLNYAEISKLEEELEETFLVSVNSNSISQSTISAHSFAEYVHKSNFSNGTKADLILYKGENKDKLEMLEYAEKKSKYISSSQTISLGEQKIISLEYLKDSIRNHRQVLTASFRNAIEELSKECSIGKIGRFITRYGTHVIIYSKMGAKLNLEVSVSEDSFTEYWIEKDFTENSVALLFDKKKAAGEDYKYINVYKKAKTKLKVSGGKVSLLNEAIFNPSFNNDKITSKSLTDWNNSIVFHHDDYVNNNVEMIEMDVIPIWEIIDKLYPKVAKAIKSRVESSVSTLQEILGTQHFANTSFNVDYPSITSKINGTYKTFNNPFVVNIIASGRYVATICREFVPDISKTDLINVAYPIYDRVLHIRNGLAIYNDEVYEVEYAYGRFNVKKLNTLSSGKFYLTNGLLSTKAKKGIEYVDSHPIIGYEWPGSVDSDGDISGDKCVEIRKFMGDFYLENNTNYTNLPNWSKRTSVNGIINADYLKSYDNFFNDKDIYTKSGLYIDKSGLENLNNRMVMDNDYEFFWNAKEVNY